MQTRSLLAVVVSLAVGQIVSPSRARAADPAPPSAAATQAGQGAAPKAAAANQPGHVPGTILLTVFLRHDQSKNLQQINDELWKNGYFDQFPPDGVEVVSWYVVMNIGQIVTLRVPAEKLREVNVVLERTAWGPYRTDFHPTYDYKLLAEQQRQQMRARKK